MQHIRSAEEISKITDTLSSGRYALACVQARVAGRPLPEHRVPCFFNPQHGPSARDVLWTQPGRGTRTVPACAQDAARIQAHELPEVRKVRIGGRAVPYWEAWRGLPSLRPGLLRSPVLRSPAPTRRGMPGRADSFLRHPTARDAASDRPDPVLGSDHELHDQALDR